jgi:Holliday junction resolvasome RuvABC endonuclease subunit
MKKAVQSVAKRYDRVIGIDVSTKLIAVTVVDRGEPLALVSVGLPRGDINLRLSYARKWFSIVLDVYKPGACYIEAPILVQNPLATKHLAYMVGILFGECLERGIETADVPPMEWKSHIGYRAISKQERERVLSEYGETEGRKELRKIRKAQVQEKLKDRYPMFAKQLESDDLADALGIALYCWEKLGKHN